MAITKTRKHDDIGKNVYSGVFGVADNTGPQKKTFFLSRGFQYDIPMYFFPLKPNPQPVEPLYVRILT